MGSGFGDKKMLQDAMALANSFKKGGGKNERRDHGFSDHIDKKRKQSHQSAQTVLGPPRVALRNYPSAGAFAPTPGNVAKGGPSLLGSSGMDFLQRKDDIAPKTETIASSTAVPPSHSLTTAPNPPPQPQGAVLPWVPTSMMTTAPPEAPQSGLTEKPRLPGWGERMQASIPPDQKSHAESHTRSTQSQPLQVPVPQAAAPSTPEELFKKNFLAFAPPAMFQDARNVDFGQPPMGDANPQPTSAPQNTGIFLNPATPKAIAFQSQEQVRQEDTNNTDEPWKGRFNALLNAGQSAMLDSQAPTANSGAPIFASSFQQAMTNIDKQKLKKAKPDAGQPAVALQNAFQKAQGRFQQALDTGKQFTPAAEQSQPTLQETNQDKSASVKRLPGLASSRFAGSSVSAPSGAADAGKHETVSQGPNQQTSRGKNGSSGLGSSMFAGTSASVHGPVPQPAPSNSAFLSSNQQMNATFQSMTMNQVEWQTHGSPGPQPQSTSEEPKAIPWPSNLSQDQQTQSPKPSSQMRDSSTASAGRRKPAQGLATSRWAS